jgi:CO/xanthine dehydrogenase FAD-binding subunit
MSVYFRPKTIEEVLAVLEPTVAGALVFAGGTDILPRWVAGTLSRPESILDLKHIEQLEGISRANGEVRIGACTTMSEIAASPVIQSTAPALVQAAGRIACPQVRNRATIGGNLCNASPAADTAIPLLLLGAVLELASRGTKGISVREVPITAFFRGPGLTVLVPGELVTQVRFKPQGEKVFAAWDKFGTRPSMEIAVASVGVAVEVANGTVAFARVAYGSVAPTPFRGQKAEAELVGNKLSASVIAACAAAARDEIAPITDVRASEGYRREVVAVMLRRMLERAADSEQR